MGGVMTKQISIVLPELTLTPPEDWQMVSFAMVGPVEQDSTAKNPQKSQFQKNVVVSAEPAENNDSAESFARRQAEKLKEAGLFIKQIGGFEKVALANGD